MLNFQLTQYPFRLGLAEGTDPRQVPPGTLLTAENCVWKQSGRLEKRFGVTSLANGILGGGTLGAISRMFTRGTELCATDGASLYCYSSGLTLWKSAGRVPEVAPTWRTLLDSITGMASTDVGYGNGLVVHAWTTGDPWTSNAQAGLFVQVVDQQTGSVVLAPTQVSSSVTFGVRVLVIGTTAIVLTRLGGVSPYTISAVTINLASPTAVSNVSALRLDVADNSGLAPWDACVIGSTFVIGYNATGPVVKLASYDANLNLQTTGSISGETTGCTAISIDGASGEVLYVLYASGVATPIPARIAIANPATLAQTVAPVNIETPAATFGQPQLVGVRRLDATHCVAAYTMLDGTGSQVFFRTDSWVVTSTASVTTNTHRRTYWESMLTRPIVLGSRCYLAVNDFAVSSASTVTGANASLLEAETSSIGALSNVPHRYVAGMEPLIAGRVPQSATLPTAAAISSTVATVATPFQATPAAKFSNWRQGARLLTLSVGASLPADMWRSTFVGQEGYIAGGSLTAYDGRLAFDYGFARAPFVETAATSGAGGLILAGTYLYGALQEYRSSAGVLHRSPTAVGVSLTTSGTTSTNTVRVAGVNVSSKQTIATGFGTAAASRTNLPVFRSTLGGSTYQRLSYEPGFNTLTADETAADQTLTDMRADASIDGSGTTLASRPAIYTTGGILDDYAPPASVTMFHHADRLWVLAGDQRTWWYSKAFQDDAGTAPGFNPAFLITFDDVQTAGATMDDKAIFFSATGVRYMLGTGPAANGANSDFTAPVVIQSDVGCTNARSVVGTPDGVMFLSDRGIYLLTRGLELAWIGRDVQNELAAYPVVTSATLVAKQNIVRFTCNAADGLSGIVLVYDYVQKQWTTAKYHDGTTYGCAIADACMWNGAWTFATPAGLVFTESTATYLDSGHYVPMTLETAWISASGPLAFQSVREFQLHGQSFTDHDLTVSVGFDSDTSYPQVATFPATGAVTSVGIEECTVSIGTRRKCETIRFKIADATPSAGTLGIGRGPAFDMMGLEVGMKRGFASNPATKRA